MVFVTTPGTFRPHLGTIEKATELKLSTVIISDKFTEKKKRNERQLFGKSKEIRDIISFGGT